MRIDADQLRRFTERVEKGGDLRAALRAGAVVIFPADDRVCMANSKFVSILCPCCDLGRIRRCAIWPSCFSICW